MTSPFILLDEAVEAIYEDNNRLRKKCNEQAEEIEKLRLTLDEVEHYDTLSTDIIYAYHDYV